MNIVLNHLEKNCTLPRQSMWQWKKGGWWNYKIVYDSYDSESDEEEDE